MSTLHWAGNLFFTRHRDGAVRIRQFSHDRMKEVLGTGKAFPADEGDNADVLDQTIPGNEWVSIIATMSALNVSDVGAAYRLAESIHNPPTKSMAGR